MSVTASYYDGLSAYRFPVILAVENGLLHLHGEQIQRELKPEHYKILKRLGNSPRLILLADGGRCEILDVTGFEGLLKQLNPQSSLVVHLESGWNYALSIVLLTFALLTLGYFFGLPYVAEKIAYQVPEKILVLIDQQFLKIMDDGFMQPSKLAPTRQQTLLNRLQTLKLPPTAVKPGNVLFRSSLLIGANAFALPGGTVLIMDELVTLSKNDEEIIAVFAHELGHVAERHALRQIVQASVVGVVVAWFVGDFSGILAVAPATLLETRYSRDFERHADSFARDILQLNAIPTQRLADILNKLEKSNAQVASNNANHLMDYFSSHPRTEERTHDLIEKR